VQTTAATGALTTPSIFAPVSTPAFAIREVGVFVCAIVTFIFGVVAGVTIYAIVRYRRRGGDDGREPPQVDGSTQIELAWTVVPFLIVIILLLTTTRYSFATERAALPPEAVQVTVVGDQWWWEIRYPRLGIATANELHVPVSDAARPTPTLITLESADVIHSLWIPQLAGKTDVIPGKPNRTWIEPRTPGSYVGQCAEFCGVQFGMPRRIYTYPADRGWDFWNLIASLGVPFQAAAILVFAVNVMIPLRRGDGAGDDPWDAWTLEWATTSPPPPYNLETVAVVASRRLWDLKHPDDPDGHTSERHERRLP
jgi:cytochrome c oxidase subunit II